MTDRLIIVSAHGHAAAPLQSYRPYREAKYHPALDDLEAEAKDHQGRLAGSAHPSVDETARFDDHQAMASGAFRSSALLPRIWT